MPPKGKADTAAYQALKKSIRENTIGSLYIFHGEETYLRDFYLGELKKLLPPGMEEFNLHTLNGKEFDLRTLEQMVDCLPMMSQRTMIIVNDYDLFKGDKEGLIQLLSDLPDYVCLVFVYDLMDYKADARTKLAGVLKEKGTVVAFNRQGQGDLVDWIGRRFKALDHDISREDAKYLIFLCGDLMNTLISEIGKIGAYAQERRITRQDIDTVATPQLDAVVFQMTDAIAAGNFEKAAGVLGDLLHMQEPPIKLLAVLGKQIRQLYTARLTIEHKKGTAYLMELWGMRSAYPAERLMQSARRFSLTWCRMAVIRCGETDLAMKSTGIDGETLLIDLLMDLAVKKGGISLLLKIREAVVVEGRYDKNTLSKLIDAPILTTDGFGIFKDSAQVNLLRQFAAERGLVILTDSDGAGFVIRNFLKGVLPPEQIKHAYIPDLPGKERRKAAPGKEGKLGVEGMRPDVLEKALRRAGVTVLEEAVTEEAVQPITKGDLFALGLSGGVGAAERRSRLLRELKLPEHMSANALLEVLNTTSSLEQLQGMVEKIF